MGAAAKLAFAVFLISCSSGAILGRSETQECLFFNANWERDRTNQTGVEPCYGDKDKRRHCFATWKNISGSIEIVKQGCWLDDINCYDRTDCIEKKDSPEVYFCCCEGNMCNEKFSYFPEMEVTQPTSNPVTPKPPYYNILLYSLVPLMLIAGIVICAFWVYRHHKMAYPPVLVPTQVLYLVDQKLRSVFSLTLIGKETELIKLVLNPVMVTKINGGIVLLLGRIFLVPLK